MSLSLVSARPDGFEPLSASDLRQLQAQQFQHDETYHREIARLPVQRRLTHMTLHFAKYCGRLADSNVNEQLTVVDIFVIALSSANILGFVLAEPGRTGKQRVSRKVFERDLTIAMGRMSAACEKLDHLEDFPFRSVLRDSVKDIAKVTMAYAENRGWNLKTMVMARLEGVRSRAFLPDQMD